MTLRRHHLPHVIPNAVKRSEESGRDLNSLPPERQLSLKNTHGASSEEPGIPAEKEEPPPDGQPVEEGGRSHGAGFEIRQRAGDSQQARHEEEHGMRERLRAGR